MNGLEYFLGGLIPAAIVTMIFIVAYKSKFKSALTKFITVTIWGIVEIIALASMLYCFYRAYTEDSVFALWATIAIVLFTVGLVWILVKGRQKKQRKRQEEKEQREFYRQHRMRW